MKRPLFGLRLRPFKAALLTSRKAEQSGRRDRPQLILQSGELFLHSLRIGRICEKLSTEGKTGFHTRKSEKQCGTWGHKTGKSEVALPKQRARGREKKQFHGPLLKPLLATTDSQDSDCILVPGRRNYPFGETGS